MMILALGGHRLIVTAVTLMVVTMIVAVIYAAWSPAHKLLYGTPIDAEPEDASPAAPEQSPGVPFRKVLVLAAQAFGYPIGAGLLLAIITGADLTFVLLGMSVAGAVVFAIGMALGALTSWQWR